MVPLTKGMQNVRFSTGFFLRLFIKCDNSLIIFNKFSLFICNGDIVKITVTPIVSFNVLKLFQFFLTFLQLSFKQFCHTININIDSFICKRKLFLLIFRNCYLFTFIL